MHCKQITIQPLGWTSRRRLLRIDDFLFQNNRKKKLIMATEVLIGKLDRVIHTLDKVPQQVTQENSFPLCLLALKNQLNDENTVRVKFNFVMPLAMFNKYLEPLFVCTGISEFTETFYDHPSNVCMKHSLWMKRVKNGDDETISIKHTKVRNNLVEYSELKSNANDACNCNEVSAVNMFQLLKPYNKLAYQFTVNRTSYELKTNKEVHLTLDLVTFWPESTFVVFSIYGDTSKTDLQTFDKQENLKFESQELLTHAKPCRSKIIQLLYLSSGNNNTYEHLLKECYVPDLKYQSVSIEEFQGVGANPLGEEMNKHNENEIRQERANNLKEEMIKHNENEQNEKYHYSPEQIERAYKMALEDGYESVDSDDEGYF